jgi:hypothetical protein
LAIGPADRSSGFLDRRKSFLYNRIKKDHSGREEDHAMEQNELNESLAKLRDELKYVMQIDDASRENLKKLDGDIHRVLENSGDVPAVHHQSLRASLEESVEYLETAHPTATALVSRLIKALSNMGI